ncbi:MAG TPA: peptide chain release factor N(5)-glutamine methyltransferase [Candidatus Limnocylindrales bacterium]
MAAPTTLGDALDEGVARLRASGSETARLDAELLLAHALGGVDRTAVIAHPDAPLGPEAAARFADALARRERGEPVAYIRGLKEFYGLAFAVDPRGLIPRPETELLVELAEAEVRRRLTAAPRPAGVHPLRVIDAGTGSGTIAVSLAVLLRRRGMLGAVTVLATDRSPDALQLARENAVGHGVADALRFAEADLWPAGEVADLVLANLPYVPSAEVDHLPVAASFEPRAALDGGPDGLIEIRRLLERLPDALAAGGTAFLEIGADQAEAVAALVADLPGAWQSEWFADLAGRPRLVRVTAG